MGHFLTLEELQVRVKELDQIAGDGRWNAPEGVTLDEARVDAAFAYVDQVILGRVTARHPWVVDVETAGQPQVLKGICADMVRYRLRDEGGNRSQVSDDVRDRNSAAMRLLTEIRDGSFDLPIPDGVVAPAPDGALGHVQAAGPAPRADDLLEGFR